MDETLPSGVVLAPCGHKLGEVVGAKDGRVAGQVVKAVCDYGNHNVQHDEGAEEDEGDEVEIGDGAAAQLFWVRHVQLSIPAGS